MYNKKFLTFDLNNDLTFKITCFNLIANAVRYNLDKPTGPWSCCLPVRVWMSGKARGVIRSHGYKSC